MHVNVSNVNFDELAADYDRYRTGYGPELYDALLTLGFTNGSSIVDVGCGTGLSAAPLVARGLRVVGVDPSAKMLTAARARVPSMKLAQAKAEKLPFENGAFEGATSAQAFHWFDQPAALAEMLRVTRHGGPIAVWWKMLAGDDDVRRFRIAVGAQLGFMPPTDPLKSGFRAFYGAPFTRRALRVIPFALHASVAQWIGYERSRAQARNAYGAGRDAYLHALEARLLETYGRADARMEVRYTQYLYVGYA